MSNLSISSFSAGGVESNRRTAASRNSLQDSERVDAKPTADARDSRGAQRLERALMSALKSLASTEPVASADVVAGPASGASAVTSPASGSSTATATADTAKPSAEASIKEAVHEFAHELAQALRASNDGERFHGGHGRRGTGGYAEVSQQLDLRSERPPIKVGPAAPNSNSGGTKTLNDNPVIVYQADPTPLPVKSAPIKEDMPILVTPATDATSPAADSAATAAASTPPDRLLNAFTHLFDALQGNKGASGTPVDYAGKLRDFLHSLGDALSPNAGTALPTSGGLLDVSA